MFNNIIDYQMWFFRNCENMYMFNVLTIIIVV